MNSATEHLQIACPENELDRFVVHEVLSGTSYPAPPLTSSDEIKVIADIGAHVGATAIRFHRMFPQARIVCYEPCAETVGYLRRNAGEFAEVCEYGLAAENCTSGYVRRFGALVTTSAGNCGLLEGTLHLRNAAELNDLRPDLIKVDTEGMEVEIIRAALAAFRAAKVVYVEYHRPEDRRTIDELLGPSKLLFSARTNGINQGELAYIEREFASPGAMAWNAI